MWEELNAESKVFREGQFSSEALMHNLRPADWGTPLREVRNSFWSNPHKPLLPDGDGEFTKAIHQAILDGVVRLADEDGTEVRPTRPRDIHSHPRARLHRVEDESDPGSVPPTAVPGERSDPPPERAGHWQANLNVMSAMGRMATGQPWLVSCDIWPTASRAERCNTSRRSRRSPSAVARRWRESWVRFPSGQALQPTWWRYKGAPTARLWSLFAPRAFQVRSETNVAPSGGL